jgi:hypothetical protein
VLAQKTRGLGVFPSRRPYPARPAIILTGSWSNDRHVSGSKPP